MTCTPFMSSIVSPGCAAHSWSYSFRGIGSRLHGCTDARIGFLCPAGVPAAVRSLALTDVLSRVEADAGKALEILKEYVRFPTISAHKRAQPETAAFVRRLLVENGFEAREYPTDGGPNVVFGQMIVDERKPTLLMYQHYDVQPVDPLNEWKRDPFDPTIEDGCKGILYVEMTSRTAKVDQHSSYAAIAPNPAWRLIQALMTLRDAKGRIKVTGWYKDARRPTARELRYLRASAFKADALKEFWGVSEFVGDGNDFDVLRRLIYSPTCTICGFVSGYIEQGTKTVNPAVAKAKIDFRLVPNMKQEKQFAKLRDHLIAKGFGDIELSPAKEALEAAAISLSARVVKAAIKGSVDAYGREPEVWPWSAGASAHGFFNEVVGVPSISGPGVSYDGGNYHSPTEHCRVEACVRGSKHMAAMFARM